LQLIFFRCNPLVDDKEIDNNGCNLLVDDKEIDNNEYETYE
jgi:hypothetical protein